MKHHDQRTTASAGRHFLDGVDFGVTALRVHGEWCKIDINEDATGLVLAEAWTFDGPGQKRMVMRARGVDQLQALENLGLA